MHCKCKQELFFLLTQLSLTYWFSGWSFPVTFCYCLLITQLVLFLRCAWYTTSKQRFYHGRYSFTFYPRGSCWHSLIIFVARQQTSVKWWCWMAKCFPMLVMGLSTPIIWRTKAPICSDIFDVDRYAAFMSMLNKLYLWEKNKSKRLQWSCLGFNLYIWCNHHNDTKLGREHPETKLNLLMVAFVPISWHVIYWTLKNTVYFLFLV